MIDQPPESLVRGCNDPIFIGVLSDWIEEQYGVALDLDRSGWSLFANYQHDFVFGDGNEELFGDCLGNGNGCGCFYGAKYHSGNGNGYGRAYGFGWGDGNGSGYVMPFGWNTGNGSGNGFGYGYGYKNKKF